MFNLAPTPFDVRLVAFGIPVRVHPSFWLAMILLGWSKDRPQITFIWVVCGFVSVLIHELGHALTAERFGWPSEIVLYFGGGLALSQRYRNNTAWRNILVSFMGPGAGFLFLGQLMMVEYFLDRNGLLIDSYRHIVFLILRYMNYYWGLLNLLPVLPLDGGHILQSSCSLFGFRDPLNLTLKVSAVVAGAAAYYFFVKSQQQFAGMLMLMLCFQSVSSLQSRR